MSKYEDRVIECNESKADELLGSGSYVFVGCYVSEDARHDEGVGYVTRKMIYCLVKKEYMNK